MRSREQAQTALSGEAESQDTQEVMGQYHEQFGVGFTSSSPTQPIPADEVQAEIQRCPRPPKVHQKFAGANVSAQHWTSSSKSNANAPKTRANTDAKVKANAQSRGQSAKEDPATAGSCKGAEGKGRGADAGSSAAKRPGGDGTKSNASDSRASSPSHRATPAHSPKQATPSEAAGVFDPDLGSHSGDEDVHQQQEDTVIPLTSQTGPSTGTVNPTQLTVLNNDAEGVVASSAKQPKPRRRKMNPSQSPTQSNDGRSYEQYISRGDDLIPTDPVEKPELASQQTSHSGDGDRTLQEDDTGAVNFRNIDEYNDNFSVPDSLGTGRPSHGSPDHFVRNPETPAPHKNPFAGSKAHLLPASQMFGQTQVSSAYKVISPTSSRPSPDNFQPQNSISPNLFISSPLKNLGAGLQPLHGGVSSPQLSIPYDTSPQRQNDELGELTGAAVDSTPLHPARTFPRGRVEEYEPLYTSQQAYDSSPQHALENESDGNASEDDAMRRHYKAMFKKAKAEKRLESIKYERRFSLEDAVVPSTNTRQGEDQKTDSQNYLDQCEGRADDYSQITAEDSQDRVVLPTGGDSDTQNAVIDDSQDGRPGNLLRTAIKQIWMSQMLHLKLQSEIRRQEVLWTEPHTSPSVAKAGRSKGMVFAVSFQAKHPGEKDSSFNSRMGLSTKVGDQIRQGGGKLLLNGFEQLFEFGAIKNAEVASSTPQPDEEIKLTADARAAGFTALISDGHSRKVKYMQALALGLPCIHPRWITTCTEKQKLVDWSDYLLCAGNSSFLGEAIRSRNLPNYDAASAKLSDVIDSRQQLLRGSRILLVLRKQDEGMKMAYVFLTRVLGASLSRVYTIDEARRQLKTSEDAGHPYDWVFVEEKMAGRAALFAEDTSSTSTARTASRKRKRKSAADAANPAPKRIRTLSNELVIQSLILGRLIGDDEDIG
ncbi:radiation sensitive protein rad9 [Diaporthe eres]|uniref:Radiation sensitive protein rad9 n=1 Tax=Diaporthe eres TaxID=83184 RepID=A0ABR1NX07_DIAER